MSTTPWHLDDDLVERYANGYLGPAASASLEAHLTACALCRTCVRRADPDASARVWGRVRAEIAAPRLPLPLRGLHRLGLREPDAVLIAASRVLHVSWALSVAGTLVFALAAATSGESRARLLLLLIAPLLPSLAVVAAYDTTDPVREIVETAPFSKLRLALLRSLVAVGGSVPLLLVLSLVVTGSGLGLSAWVLPSLALTALALVLLTWWPTRTVASVLVVGWVGACGVIGTGDVAAGMGTLATQAGALATALGSLAILRRVARPRPVGGVR